MAPLAWGPWGAWGMGSAPLLSPRLGCPFLLHTVPKVSLAPVPISTIPTLVSVARSVHLALESLFWQSSGRFLGYLQ